MPEIGPITGPSLHCSNGHTLNDHLYLVADIGAHHRPISLLFEQAHTHEQLRIVAEIGAHHRPTSLLFQHAHTHDQRRIVAEDLLQSDDGA